MDILTHESVVLVLSPHTDDGELGAGGTMARLVDEGIDVYYAAFSSADESLPPGMPKGSLKLECLNATKALGLPISRVRLFNHRVRTFPSVRQKILDEIIGIREELSPRLVLVPSLHDVHQDHKVIVEEALRAFKTSSSIWGYEHPWNNLSFDTNILVSLQGKHVARKLEALKRYESQHDRQYFNERYLQSILRVRGTQANVEFAEAFELVRLLIS